jgi:hypothetical protein
MKYIGKDIGKDYSAPDRKPRPPKTSPPPPPPDLGPVPPSGRVRPYVPPPTETAADVGPRCHVASPLTGSDAATTTAIVSPPAPSSTKAKRHEVAAYHRVSDLIDVPHDPALNLLGDRFLCRGGAMVFVGPSGVGKSSASMVQDLSWACGRSAFGIKPAGPLKVLLVQAENDMGDMSELAGGAIDSMSLSIEELDVIERNFVTIQCANETGDAFLAWLDVQAEEHKPDLIRIDPLLAYLGADPVDTKALSDFCRRGLNGLLARHQCGLVLCHHTPKTTGRDTAAWKPIDAQYAGGGSADLTNWARAIIVIDGTNDPLVFQFIAAKRGKRIGWTSQEGLPSSIKFFSHAAEAGRIEWRAATPDQVEALIAGAKKKRKAELTEEDFLDALPPIDIENPMKGMLTMKKLDEALKGKEKPYSKSADMRDKLEKAKRIYVIENYGKQNATLVGRVETGELLKSQEAQEKECPGEGKVVTP